MFEGLFVGRGVGTEPMYVGTSVGDTVGAVVGEALGSGVGTEPWYVGSSVGASVGALEGFFDGCGVGFEKRVGRRCSRGGGRCPTPEELTKTWWGG